MSNTERGKLTFIVGGPKAGKTTLAKSMPGDVFSLDVLIESHPWGDLAYRVAEYLSHEMHNDTVVEGIQAARVLRKMIQVEPGRMPCDEVIFMEGAKVELTPGQKNMAKGVTTIFRQIVDDLVALGVKINVW